MQIEETPVKLNTIIVSAKQPVNEATFCRLCDSGLLQKKLKPVVQTNINDVLETYTSDSNDCKRVIVLQKHSNYRSKIRQRP